MSRLRQVCLGGVAFRVTSVDVAAERYRVDLLNSFGRHFPGFTSSFCRNRLGNRRADAAAKTAGFGSLPVPRDDRNNTTRGRVVGSWRQTR